MIGSGLLEKVVIVEAGLILIALALYLGYGSWRGLLNKRDRRALAAARVALADVAQDRRREDSVAVLQRVPTRISLLVFEEIAPRVSGRARLHVSEAASALGVREGAARRCSSSLWWRRLRAARILTLVGGGAAAMTPLLDDKTPEVRAQAAEWASEHPTPEVIEKLLSMLEDPRGLARFTVQNSLLQLAGLVAEPLLARLERETPPLPLFLAVARWLADHRFSAIALRLSRHADVNVRLATSHVLGAIGGPVVLVRLEELLDDRDPRVRAAAAVAIGRLGHWPSAPQVARHLGDVAWEVRKAAGAALAALGPPGALLLRRAKASEDRFAADMAIYVLGLPQGLPEAAG
ncbi:MAG: HEAT repeat domain-containing protein [Actinomycetota bacterium]